MTLSNQCHFYLHYWHNVDFFLHILTLLFLIDAYDILVYKIHEKSKSLK